MLHLHSECMCVYTKVILGVWDIHIDNDTYIAGHSLDKPFYLRLGNNKMHLLVIKKGGYKFIFGLN